MQVSLAPNSMNKCPKEDKPPQYAYPTYQFW